MADGGVHLIQRRTNAKNVKFKEDAVRYHQEHKDLGY